MTAGFPSLKLDAAAVLLGAATHDLGKTLHPEELVGPGRRHEFDGPGLLQRFGLPEEIARFAATHGTWESEQVTLEDRLVALADNLWQGRRREQLERLVVAEVATQTSLDQWAVFYQIDTICERLAARSDERLQWQVGGTA